MLVAWTLWHDVGIYSAIGPTRLGGEVYAATGYDSEAACQVGRRAAIANEASFRRGAMTDRLSDGVIVWDLGRRHYTTFQYRCAFTGG